MNDELIKKAIFEAIFWWQKSECFYSESFKNAYNQKFEENNIHDFLKIFQKFLTDYAIRRNMIGEGEKPIIDYINICFSKKGLLNNLNGSKNIGQTIDLFTEQIKKEWFSGNKKLLSLVAKTSFLFKPEEIPLYDQQAKRSLEREFGDAINSFEDYFKKFKEFKERYYDDINKQLKYLIEITNLFCEFKVVNNKKEFLIQRSTDKILWLIGK